MTEATQKTLADKALSGLSEADKRRVLRVMHDLGVDPNDSAVILLAASGRLERLAKGLPEAMIEAGRKVIGDMAAQQREVLGKTIGQVALQVADKAASKRDWQWLSVMALAIVATCALAVGMGYRFGQQEMKQTVAAAVAEAKAQIPVQTAWAADFDSQWKRAVAAWAISEEGQTANYLSKLNNGFKEWLQCDFGNGIGLVKEIRGLMFCIPATEDGKRGLGLVIRGKEE